MDPWKATTPVFTDFLDVESFSSLLEYKVLDEEHRDKYNHR